MYLPSRLLIYKIMTLEWAIIFSFYTFHCCLAQPYIQFGHGPAASGDCFKDFQFLRDRFSWEQLQFFCQQWRAYSEDIDANHTVVVPFTDNQNHYLRSLSVGLNATVNQNPMTVRKEYRAMTETERSIFHFVLRALKQQKIDGISKYDLLVMLSHPALAPGAHVGAAFLPWHREYLRMFERAMQKINVFAALPYWDVTLDQGLPNAVDSILWEPDFLGNGDGVVTSGPFAGWILHPVSKKDSKVENSNDTDSSDELLLPLTRNISAEGRLMSPDDANYVLSRSEFRQFSACVDLRLEQTSRRVHEWVGGSMYNVQYAANDPVFFLFHCYIDYLWEEWRRNATYDHRVHGYPAAHEACTRYHYATAPMSPFEPLINADGLSDAYTRLYYTYQVTPKCSSADPTCLSRLFFCHQGSERCLTKIGHGGNCTGLEHYDPCYQSKCVNGRCSAEPDTGTHVKPLNGTESPRLMSLGPELVDHGPPGPPGMDAGTQTSIRAPQTVSQRPQMARKMTKDPIITKGVKTTKEPLVTKGQKVTKEPKVPLGKNSQDDIKVHI